MNNNICNVLKYYFKEQIGKFSIFITTADTPNGHYHSVKWSQRVKWSGKKGNISFISPTWRHQFPSIVQLFFQTMPDGNKKKKKKERAWKLFLILFSSSLIYSFPHTKARRRKKEERKSCLLSLHPPSPSSHFCIILAMLLKFFEGREKPTVWVECSDGWNKKSKTLDGH